MGTSVLAIIVCGATSYVFGQTPTPSSGNDLAAMARAAKEQFRPLTPADAQVALAGLTAAVKDLDGRLAAAGPGGQDWKKYVLWDSLQAQLQQPKPDLDVLGKVFQRLAAGHEGLELKWFVGVRKALRQYIELLGAVDNAGVKEVYVAELEKLAKQLDAYAAHPDTDTAVELPCAMALAGPRPAGPRVDRGDPSNLPRRISRVARARGWCGRALCVALTKPSP